MKEKVRKVKKKKCGEQPIIHREWKAEVALKWMWAQGWWYKRFTKPKELTILTVHNYNEKSLFERSMDFTGIKGYEVLKTEGEWKHTNKLVQVRDYIRNGRCKTDYLLFCDARDCVMWDDPKKIVEIFERFNCKLLFNSTMSPVGCYRYWKGEMYHKGLDEKLYNWSNRIGVWKRYLNSGVFIGKPLFIEEVLDFSLRYISDTITSDQGLIRTIQPIFHPYLKVDYGNELVYRN